MLGPFSLLPWSLDPCLPGKWEFWRNKLLLNQNLRLTRSKKNLIQANMHKLIYIHTQIHSHILIHLHAFQWGPTSYLCHNYIPTHTIILIYAYGPKTQMPMQKELTHSEWKVSYYLYCIKKVKVSTLLLPKCVKEKSLFSLVRPYKPVNTEQYF